MTAPRIEFSVPGYEILDVRRADGSGGWLVDARDRDRDRRVLLKIIERRPAGDAGEIRVEERLRREARAAARVHHPSVVRVFDLGETPALLYLVMERVDAPDADSVVRRQGPLPVDDACRVARDVARGLEELHRCGVVHRDITPGNVLIPPPGADGEAIIIDLGLARLRDASHGLTAEDVLLGTPGFMAPEQAENPRDADARADLYGLGALLFFLLTGRPPFIGEGLEAVRLALKGGAPDVRTLRPDVPPPLARLLARLLARDPGDRPAGAAEVAGALDAQMDQLAETQAVTTGDLPTPPAGPAVAAPGDAPAVRGALGVAGFVAGLVGVVAVAFAVLGDRSTPGRREPRAPATPVAPSTGPTAPRSAPSPAPPIPTPPAPPALTPDQQAVALFQHADEITRIPPMFGNDWPRFVAAHHLLSGIALRFRGTFAARIRVPQRFHALAETAAENRRRATARLVSDVDYALLSADYAFAAEAIDAANAVLVDREVRLRLNAEVLDAAREAFERTYQDAAQFADAGRASEGVQLLERMRLTAHPRHRPSIDRLIAAMQRPGTRGAAPGTREVPRPAAPIHAVAEHALARRKAAEAVRLLESAIANPAFASEAEGLRARLAEAQSVAAFFDHLLAALAGRVGTRVLMPGGQQGELLAVDLVDGHVVWRRAGGKSGRRLGELRAAFLAELADAVLRPLGPGDAMALGVLFVLEGDDTAALERFQPAGAVADRLRALAQRRVDAGRDERARALLDRARAAWVRGSPSTALDRLNRLQRGSLLREEGPVRESFDDLFALVSRRLSGLDRLVAAHIRAGAAPADLRLDWTTSDMLEADRDPRAAGAMLVLTPRWGAPLAAELTRPGGAVEADRRYRIALRTPEGSEVEATLHPNGTLSLRLDGREADSVHGASMPLRLALVRAGGRQTLEVTAGTARIDRIPWAADRRLAIAVDRTPARLRVSGAVDPDWLHAARAEADRPGAPGSVRLVGPPHHAVVTWSPPLRGTARGYRVWVAVSEGPDVLAPLGVFTHVGDTRETTASVGRLAKGAVLGVFIEPFGLDGHTGPASPAAFVADLRGAGAVAVGGEGERYVTLPGATPLVRLRADGRPEAVAGTPTMGRRTSEAPRGLAVATGRNGWRIALTDPGAGHAWSWLPGESPAALGAGVVQRGGGVAVDAIGNWWIAAPGQGRLFSFYGRDHGLIAPVEGPEGSSAYDKRAPAHVAVLHDGRIAASDPANARVVVYESRLGWFSVQSIVGDLPGAGALAAGPRGTLWVATRDGFAAVTPPARAGGEMAAPVHVRTVAGIDLKRVTGLASDRDGALWVLDGAAGRLLRYLP